MNRLRGAFAPYWQSIQQALFPQLERVLGPLTDPKPIVVRVDEVGRAEALAYDVVEAPADPLTRGKHAHRALATPSSLPWLCSLWKKSVR